MFATLLFEMLASPGSYLTARKEEHKKLCEILGSPIPPEMVPLLGKGKELSILELLWG